MLNSTVNTLLDEFHMQTNKTFEIPGYAKTNQWTISISVFILTVATLIGTGGNLLVVLVIAIFRNLRYEESVFFLNLAICDLYVTVVVDPMSALGKYRTFSPTTYSRMSMARTSV